MDGDPRHTSIVDFPCPSDELAPEIRKIGKDLLVYDKNAASNAQGELLTADRLNDLVYVITRHNHREFVFCWADSDEEWLLADDEALV